MTGPRTAGAALLAALTLTAPARADDEVSFKRRGDQEKQFAAKVGEAIVKAAHGTAKKMSLVKYEYEHPKPNRTDLVLKMEYHGAVTDKRYLAEITVKIDSTDKNAWEVLNIEYADSNANVRHNEKKIQDLIKRFNR
jgi:hypothetical protein